MIHRWPLRVYYEDTDLAGIVYYANYLKFIERARSEMVRHAAVDQTEMKGVHGIVFAVRRVTADYFKPAKYDDLIDIETMVSALKGASFDMVQKVWREDTLLFQADVSIVCLNSDGKAVRIPADIRHKIETITAFGRD
ncbi:MAG: acyl-CoA thioester hydrolase [Paracoccaceae bacterium]|jgi:acyl-CoA thioester hydrolase